MINQTDNVHPLHELTRVEKQVLQRWYKGDASKAFARGISMNAGGRFYVVEGDYIGRTTKDLSDSLHFLCDHKRHNSPTAKRMAMELALRKRGQYSMAPTDPDGPRAA